VWELLLGHVVANIDLCPCFHLLSPSRDGFVSLGATQVSYNRVEKLVT